MAEEHPVRRHRHILVVAVVALLVAGLAAGGLAAARSDRAPSAGVRPTTAVPVQPAVPALIKDWIFADQIWTSWAAYAGWRDYVHPSRNRTNAVLRHLDHVHVAVESGRPYRLP